MSDPTNTIMSRLREETRELHSHAESRPLQQQIARGDVDRDRFAAYLGQLYLVHQKLESALQNAASGNPAIGKLATVDRMRVPDLESDLRFYRLDPNDLEPGAAAIEFHDAIDRMNAEDPVALLGSLYVLEGSTNGGKFLARVLRREWNLDEEGLSYFDPYGNEQPQRWAAFKSDMEDMGFDTDQQNAIVDAAHLTFKAIADVSDGVSRSA